MEATVGYVGTLEAESRNDAQIWFGLTKEPTGSDWVTIAGKRAWFTMSMESVDRPTHMAQLTLLLEAMRSELQVKVRHDGAATFFKSVRNDSFEVNGVRILRTGLQF